MAARPAPSQSEVERAFSDAMQAAGFQPGSIQADTPGFVRFDAPGDKKGKGNGFYKLRTGQYPVGWFGDWKVLEQHSFDFHKETGTELSRGENAARRAALSRLKAQAEQERDEQEAAVARDAARYWERADRDPSGHPYAARKRLSELRGLRARRKPDGTHMLVVPMWAINFRGEPQIVGLQEIGPRGEKRFLAGQRMRGAFFHIEGDRSLVVFCEGVATGYSIADATRATVVVTFNAGNLPVAGREAAMWLRAAASAENREQPTFLVAADNDVIAPDDWAQRNPGKPWVNAGVKGARKASEDIGCKWIMPVFDAGPARDRTDFNDLHAAQGIEEVGAQIGGAIAQPKLSDEPDGSQVVRLAYVRDESWRSQIPVTSAGAQDGGNIRGIEVYVRNHPKLKDRLRFNLLAQRIEVDGRPIRDNDVNAFRSLMHREGLKARKPDVKDEMIREAERAGNSYDPLLDYLAALEWDGVPRLDQWLFRHLGAEPANAAQRRYLTAVGRKFLVGAVARATRPGCKMDTMLVLEGPQGGGKSSALRELFGAAYFVDHLPDFHSKDSFIQLLGTWCVEVAELSAMSKADVKDVKQFLSRQVDHFRLPHATFAEDHQRRTVFAGTVNPGDNGYLRDEENRRFWPVVCGAIDLAALLGDRDQLWAEAVRALGAGETWYLSNDDVELARIEQDARRETGNWDEPMRNWVVETGRDHATVDDVFEHMTKTAVDLRKKMDRDEIGKAFRRMGWVPIKRSGKRIYMAPDARAEEVRTSPLASASSWLTERDPVDAYGR